MTVARYQLFNFPPNWDGGISIKYVFNTGIFVSEHYKEQRKPMKSLPCMEMSYNIFVENEAPQAMDYLRASLKGIFYLPIWTEAIVPVSAGVNLSHIVTNSLSYFFNLKYLTQYVLVMDRRNIVDPKLATLTAIGSNSIDIAPIVWTYDPINTRIYPVTEAILESMKKVSYTPVLEEMQLTFKDYVTGKPDIVIT